MATAMGRAGVCAAQGSVSMRTSVTRRDKWVRDDDSMGLLPLQPEEARGHTSEQAPRDVCTGSSRACRNLGAADVDDARSDATRARRRTFNQLDRDANFASDWWRITNGRFRRRQGPDR